MGMFGIGDKQPLSFNPQASQPLDAGANQLIPMAGPQQVSAPFFGKGGTGRNVLLGGLGGALDGVARWGGAQPGYANAMQQQQEQAQQEQQYQRQQKDGIAKMIMQAQIEQAYKQPDQTAFAKDLAAAGIDPNSEQGRGLYQQYITNRANPLMSAQGYDAQGNPVLNMFPRFPDTPKAPQMGQQPAQQPADIGSDPKETLMFQAQEALRKGAPYDAVMSRLNEQINALGGQ